MKILIVSDYYPPEKLGGVGEIARQLASQYRLRGHETYVLTTGRHSDPSSHVFRTGPNLPIGILRNNWRIAPLIRSLDIDLVHLHQASSTLFLLSRLIGRMQNVRVISSYQVSYAEEMRQIRPLEIRGFKIWPTRREYVEKYVFGPVHVILDMIGFQLADDVTAVSSETRNEIMRSYGRLGVRDVRIVPNGSEMPYDHAAANDSKLAFQLKPGQKAVLYLGVYRMRKRVFNVLLAMKELVDVGVPAVLMLVGGGRSYEKRVLSMCDRLGLKEHVLHFGPVPHSEVDDYIRAADIICVPSSYEGMPMVILEAMAAGCAVVTSSVSGMKDLIRDRENGFLVAVDDIEGLASTMKEALEDDELRKSVSAAARADIAGRYGWNQIASRYLEEGR